MTEETNFSPCEFRHQTAEVIQINSPQLRMKKFEIICNDFAKFIAANINKLFHNVRTLQQIYTKSHVIKFELNIFTNLMLTKLVHGWCVVVRMRLLLNYICKT